MLNQCDIIVWDDRADGQLLASMISEVSSSLMLSLCSSNDTMLSVFATIEFRRTSATYLT